MTSSAKAQTAAIYTRVSMDASGEGAAVARQLAECEELAVQQKLKVVARYRDDAISAFSGKARPGFERMLADARAGQFDVLLVWRTDRLYRRLADLLRTVTDLNTTDIAVQTVMSGRIDFSTADGRLQAHLLGSIAEHESSVKGERVRSRARQRLTIEGRQTTGRRPFGWAWKVPDPNDESRPLTREGLVPHGTEAPLLREAYMKFANGSENLSGVARWLTDNGATGTRGGPIIQARVSNILRQPRHAGLLVDSEGQIIGEAADGFKIVDRDLWERVQLILSDPSRRRKPGRPSVSLLGSIAVCGVCGGPVRSGSNGSRGGVRYKTYDCRAARHVSRVRTAIDGPIVEMIGKYLEKYSAVMNEAIRDASSDDTAAKEKRRLEERLEQLAKLVARGQLSVEDYAAAAKEIRQGLGELQHQVFESNPPPALGVLTGKGDKMTEAWRELVETDVPAAREVIKFLVAELVVLPRRGGVEIAWAT